MDTKQINTNNGARIIYTKTDEAPALATYSLFPIIKAFLSLIKIPIEIKDISLAGRILACFSDQSKTSKSDDLLELSKIVRGPTANIIKLPNISASLPQLKAAINELQSQGFDIPSFPENMTRNNDSKQADMEKEIYLKYRKVLGSAVNPVLREGNSDRRVPQAIKQYVKDHPHSMGQWDSHCQSHVASMTKGDFYSSEKSVVISKGTNVTIKFIDTQGSVHILKPAFPILENEIIDASVMSKKFLNEFFEKEMADAYEKGLVLSLHLKSTMMKISDPVIFAEAIKVYFKEALDGCADDLNKLGINFCNGLNDLFSKTNSSPLQNNIRKAFEECYKKRPALAMVNSQKGITCFHSPNDVIIDSSIPSIIKSSGKVWGKDGNLHPTKALIPDRSYAGIYQQVIEFCKKNGAFDPKTMGSVSNIGLMAKKAQEYGSHDKTFIMTSDGKIQAVNDFGNTLLEHEVKKGDIWRMCQTKDEAINDWIQLAIKRSKATRQLTVFWLDGNRAHDRVLIQKVKHVLKNEDTTDLDIRILSPVEAMKLTLQEVKAGKNIIAVTGNVLRDYLTDLFPILEIGTSSKMLSIVPLLKGGGLYETGSGGTAPRHVEQLLKENHLRWDSLGEFLALAISLEDLSNKSNQFKIEAFILSEALNKANKRFLKEKKSPSRYVHELDSRGSHFYWSLYWAEAIVEQLSEQLKKLTKTENDQFHYLKKIKEKYSFLADQLGKHKEKILEEINSSQGKSVDIGGYYYPDEKRVTQIMRPSPIFNNILYH